MSRPLSGSKRIKNGTWLVSVHRRRGSTERVYATFRRDAEAAADRWLAAQVERLNAGEEAQGSTNAPRVRRSPRVRRTRVDQTQTSAAPTKTRARTFEEYAMAWHHEQYVLLHRAQAERTRDVLSDLRLHILPTFGGLLETDAESGRNALITWTRTMAGYPLTPGGTVDENAPSSARDNVNGILWIISEVLLYAHTMGAPVPVVASNGGVKPAVTNGVTAMFPRYRPKRKARLGSFAEARSLAAEMHVIHQLELWLMRVAGLRIGEAVFGVWWPFELVLTIRAFFSTI